MSKTYFISGHESVTQEEFIELYVPMIDTALSENAYFVIGDNKGVDELAQSYLRFKLTEEEQKSKVKIFFVGKEPRVLISSKYMALGGFKSYEEACVAMTLCSDEDIACLHQDKWGSRTANNIRRRYTPKFNFKKWATAENRNIEFWAIIWKDHDTKDE